MLVYVYKGDTFTSIFRWYPMENLSDKDPYWNWDWSQVVPLYPTANLYFSVSSIVYNSNAVINYVGTLPLKHTLVNLETFSVSIVPVEQWSQSDEVTKTAEF
ncbi:hypothetical protein EDD17DRAFT_1507807 [Pisolithus thermaeus]|nr:hypothetical protein EDD17DRAFT_1507807 [Pisolithus thermaeus]